MANWKPRKSQSVPHRGSISEHASDWIRRFSKELEDNFINSALSIPADSPARAYQDATIRAVFSVLLDSGMDTESFAETFGRILIERRAASVEWTSESNQRRFELIDKEIQETLTPAERIELAGLTGIMRERLESEANLPMEAAKALHRKLLGLAAKDKPT